MADKQRVLTCGACSEEYMPSHQSAECPHKEVVDLVDKQDEIYTIHCPFCDRDIEAVDYIEEAKKQERERIFEKIEKYYREKRGLELFLRWQGIIIDKEDWQALKSA